VEAASEVVCSAEVVDVVVAASVVDDVAGPAEEDVVAAGAELLDVVPAGAGLLDVVAADAEPLVVAASAVVASVPDCCPEVVGPCVGITTTGEEVVLLTVRVQVEPEKPLRQRQAPFSQNIWMVVGTATEIVTTLHWYTTAAAETKEAKPKMQRA